MVKSINIKDSHVSELIEIYGQDWQANIVNPETGDEMIPNPQSKAQFANDELTVHLRQAIAYRVQNYRKRVAQVNIDNTDITED
jgi:hypothetical protein